MDSTQQTTREERQRVARTILEQLGRGFSAMTGAHTLCSTENSLSFRVPGTITRQRINWVKIELTPADEYKLTFGVIRGKTFKVVEERDGVYCDNLREVFSSVTGLALEFPRFANLTAD